ncbi:hypothetical protein B0H10DRAFT_1959756 [Mycena sp. CBHHK59/15]|nr:hypothetical protein B0H10DRAFT_1959756 [Mycena sp. CBHHK59/15]
MLNNRIFITFPSGLSPYIVYRAWSKLNVKIRPGIRDSADVHKRQSKHPDPYDLAETERVDLSDPRPAMARSSTVFAVADYVKLDSPELAELLQPSKLPESTVATPVDDSQAGRPDDWSMDDFLS